MANTPVTREQHLLVIGKLEHNAASAEAILFGTFTLIAGLTPSLARAIFYTLDSVPGKKNLVRRVAEERADAKEKEIIEIIFSGVDATNNQRKQVAHGAMTYAGELKIYSPKNQPQPKIPSQEWHNDLLEKSHAAGMEAKTAFEALCQKRGVPARIEFE
jgi:hypothetical protein